MTRARQHAIEYITDFLCLHCSEDGPKECEICMHGDIIRTVKNSFYELETYRNADLIDRSEAVDYCGIGAKQIPRFNPKGETNDK